MSIKSIRCMLPCLLIILAGLFSCADDGGKTRPAAVQGRIDLRAWDFDADGPAALDGEWAFSWNELSAAGDPENAANRFETVPGAWHSMSAAPSRARPYGCAGYRLKVITNGAHPILALKTKEIPVASRILVDDTVILETGTVSCSAETSVPLNYPRTASFKVDRPEFILTVQVSNYRHRMAGIVRSLLLGTDEQLASLTKKQVSFDLFVFGSLFIIGLYHLGLFALRRNDLSSFWFGIFCLLMGLRTLLMNERIIYTFLPGIPWELEIRMEYSSLAIGAFFILFSRSLFPDEVNHRVVRASTAVSVIFAGIVWVTPVFVFANLLLAFHAVALAVSLYMAYVFILAAKHGREGGLIILAGFLAFLATMANDIFHSQMLIHSAFLTPFGLFIFIFSQSYIISMRTAKSFRMVEVFSRKIEEYAAQLENKVDDRTRELQDERNRLRDQAEVITREIGMARRIQQHMIPSHCPLDTISVIYLPMKLVGGDFYDFIRLENPPRMGIFMSDVSGHGVPAALITSMIKSIILQAGESSGDPAMMLNNMNSLLFDQIAGNYVTAFYGILDTRTRRLVYASAGHHAPIILNAGDIGRLPGKRTIPLGVMDNAALAARGKEYENSSRELESGSKLIVFTDGFVETTPHGDRSLLFENNGMEEALRGLSGLRSDEFIARLYECLVNFRGISDFDDDVCIICVDV